MRIKVYAVKLGGHLYVATGTYTLYQATTKNPFDAKWYQDYESAARLAKKANGEVVEWTLTDEPIGDPENLRTEIEEMKQMIKELKDRNV